MKRLVIVACAIGGFTHQARAADLIPDVLLEANHTSNVAQHFNNPATNYGYSTVSIFLHWELPKQGYIDIGDGHTIFGGTMDGFRDVFQARIGLKFSIGK